MKYLSPLCILLTLALTACDNAATDADLPQGTAPNADAQQNEAPATPTEPTPRADAQPLPAGEASATTPGTPANTLTAPGLSLTLPEGWTKGPDKAMRLLTLVPPAEFAGAELAISQWPGDVGGFGANVGRWCMQIGLPVPAADFSSPQASGYEQFQLADTTATWLPLVNEDNDAAILAVWAPRGDSTWTLKMTCKAQDAQALSTAFRALCDAITFD